MEATLLNFVASKLIELNDLSGVQYSANKNRRFKTPMVRSDLCDQSGADNVVKGIIIVTGTNNTIIKK